jgi:hypothetical protein
VTALGISSQSYVTFSFCTLPTTHSLRKRMMKLTWITQRACKEPPLHSAVCSLCSICVDKKMVFNFDAPLSQQSFASVLPSLTFRLSSPPGYFTQSPIASEAKFKLHATPLSSRDATLATTPTELKGYTQRDWPLHGQGSGYVLPRLIFSACADRL